MRIRFRTYTTIVSPIVEFKILCSANLLFKCHADYFLLQLKMTKIRNLTGSVFEALIDCRLEQDICFKSHSQVSDSFLASTGTVEIFMKLKKIV